MVRELRSFSTTRTSRKGSVVDKFNIDWAAEMGIDVPKLWMEHPGHPTQLKNKGLIIQQAELFWVTRHLESLWADSGVSE